MSGPVVASSTRCAGDQVVPPSIEREARIVAMPVVSDPIQMRWTEPSGGAKNCGAARSPGEGPASTTVFVHEAPGSAAWEAHRVETRVVGTISFHARYTFVPRAAIVGITLFASDCETWNSGTQDAPPSKERRTKTCRRVLFRASEYATKTSPEEVTAITGTVVDTPAGAPSTRIRGSHDAPRSGELRK